MEDFSEALLSTAISSLQFFRQLMTPVMSYMVDEKVEKMAEW